MKYRLLLLGAIVLVSVNAACAQLAGEYVDDKFLNGHATIHVSVNQKGDDVSVSFRAFHNDTPDIGVRFTATGKILPGDEAHFNFEDSCKNRGFGAVFRGKYRLRDKLKVSIRVDHISDFSCLVFYQNNIELKPMKG